MVEAYQAFFDAHYDRTARALAIVLDDVDLAQEATQEALFRAWTRWARVSAMERPEAWLYVVALNVGRRLGRRQSRARSGGPLEDRAGDGPGFEQQVEGRLALADRLRALPPRQLEAVVLYYLADLPVGDVARAMGCAEGTVKATLSGARRNLGMRDIERSGT